MLKRMLSSLLFLILSISLFSADNALDINGSGQYVDCGGIVVTGATPRTVEAWVNCRTFADRGVWTMGNPGSTLGEFTLRTHGSVDDWWVVQLWGGDFDFYVPGSKNNWTHFAITYDGTNIRVYANGELKTTQSRALNTVAGYFQIGNWSSGYFDGKIDEVRVWNVERTLEQIQSTMIVGLKGNETGLIAYYPMNEGTGTTLPDHSVNSFTGTFVGSPAWTNGYTEIYQPAGSGTDIDPFQISDLTDLYWLTQHSEHYDKYYTQTADIDATATNTWLNGDGFGCIGNSDLSFTGSYDGAGHLISNIYINRPTDDHVGVFGGASEAVIKDLGVTGVNITGQNWVGGLLGFGWITNISNSYSTGTVTGSLDVVGGLMGGLWNDGLVTNCYSTANASGVNKVGGLCGLVSNNCGFVKSYSTGLVSGTGPNVGGFLGIDELTGYATDSFWDTQTSGQISSAHGTGKTTAEMKSISTFTATGWDFQQETANGTTDIWGINPIDNSGYPFLSWQGYIHYYSSSVTTQSVTEIFPAYATGNGTISDLGGPYPTSHGVCWNTTGNPTLSDSFSDEGSIETTGSFTSSITGLTSFNKYYVKAYATNAVGTVYGDEVNFIASGTFVPQADAVNGLYFDGADDFVITDLDTQPSAITETTWEAWVKPARVNYPPDFQAILSTDDGGWDRGIWIAPNTDLLVIGYGLNGWNTGVSVTANEWQHIAIVYKTDNVLLYLNGQEYSLGIAPAGQSTTCQLTIGASANGISQWFQGEIDEVRVWDTARTKEQIQANYGSIAGNESGLAGYWRMDEGSGLFSVDRSGNGHTGTLTNGTAWVTPSTAPVYAPIYHASLSSLDFGYVELGSDSDSELTISNTGGGFLHISSAVIDNPDFTITPELTDIPSGADQIFTVTYDPAVLEADTANLTVIFNPFSSTDQIDFTGNCIRAEFSIDSTSVDFGNVKMGKLKEIIVTVTNTGSDDLFINDVIYSTSQYSVTPDSVDIAPSGNCEFTVSFLPDTLISYTDTLSFTHNGPDSPHKIPLTGSGVILAGSGTVEDPYEVEVLNDLKIISENNIYWNKHFIQIADIDATETSTWNSGQGFSYIGYTWNSFSGSYNGQDHTISNLYFNWASYQQEMGLFGYTRGATIKNLGVIDVLHLGTNNKILGGVVACLTENSEIINCYSTGTINGDSTIGGLVGKCDASTITDCYSTCTVNGNGTAGGLIGSADNFSVINGSYSTGNVTATQYEAGGLISYATDITLDSCYSESIVNAGRNAGGLIASATSCTINYSHSISDVTAGQDAGGLTAYSSSTIINNSYSNSNVDGANRAGGLSYSFSDSEVNNSYSAGTVIGRGLFTGGLIAYLPSESKISNCYSTSNVTGENYVGGLVGSSSGIIINSYSTGTVSGISDLGGLVGDGTIVNITNCYWDIETSGISWSDGGEGKTTAEMHDFSLYFDNNWDFMEETVNGTDDIWGINSAENNGYPFFSWQQFDIGNPYNLNIAHNVTEVVITWDSVYAADSYSIYSSIDPYSTFPGSWTVEVSGLTELTWTDTNATEDKKFYIVVAVNGNK